LKERDESGSGIREAVAALEPLLHSISALVELSVELP
jgi:hypothetical protein